MRWKHLITSMLQQGLEIYADDVSSERSGDFLPTSGTRSTYGPRYSAARSPRLLPLLRKSGLFGRW